MWGVFRGVSGGNSSAARHGKTSFGTMHYHHVLRPEALGFSHEFWVDGVCDAFLFAAIAHPTLDQKHRKLVFLEKSAGQRTHAYSILMP